MNFWSELIETWGKYVQEEDAKEKAIKGISLLKDILPEIERSHMLASNCQNLAPWNGPHILYVAKIINFFKDDPKFNVIKGKLLNNFSYNDTFVELEIKYSVKNCFPTIFDVRVGDRSECDAVIKVTEGLIFCEITNLGWSKANLRLSRLFNELSTFIIFEHKLNWCIRIKDFGSDEDFKKVKEDLLKRKDEFNNVNFENHHILIEKDKIDLADGKTDGSLTGPPFIDDHLEQLQKKISSKTFQCSDCHPNLLIINISSPAYYFNKKNLELYIKFFEDFLSQNHPSISGIYLVNGLMTFSDPNIKAKKGKISNSYSIESNVNEGLVTLYTHLILNNKARIGFTKNEIIGLKNLFVEKNNK